MAALCLALCGCGLLSKGGGGGGSGMIDVRQLSDAEKGALRQSLSQTLADPASAQFKWMPVLVAQRNGATPYCGLVDARSRTGADAGFHKFAARIKADSNGQYVQGVLDAVEGSPPIFAGAGPAGQGGAEEVCRASGYVDFGLAS